MTRIPEYGRIPVADSLFDRLLAADRDLPMMAVTKTTLVATSHLVETLVYEHAERCVLVSGFQYGRHWAVERDRYLAMSGENDLIALFAGDEPRADHGVDHIGLRLRTNDPLAQEWFVLAVGPGLTVTLCGLDGDAHSARQAPVREADRVFTTIWSVDPAVAAIASQVVVEALERSAPERAEAVRAQLTRAASRPPSAAEAAKVTDALLAGIMQRMEAIGLRERDLLDLASQDKSNFLSRLSHELRTPLNAILGFAQLLALDVEDAVSQDSIAQILAAGQHMLGLVDESLDIGRIEAGDLNLEAHVLPVGPIVAEALSMIAPLAAARGLEIKNEIGPDSPLVLVDGPRLRQVLLNLLSNAVKYNVDGGSVVVSVSRTLDAVRVSVRDTGVGMTRAEVNRLFMPFERLDAERRGIPGTGLGLVVSRELVEAMKGKFEIDSRPGTGTEMVIALPAAH